MLLVVGFGNNLDGNLRVLKMSGNISLQFARQHTLSSSLIQWFSGVPDSFSHVDIVTPDYRFLGARAEVESGFPAGVQIRKEGYVHFERTLMVNLPCTDAVAESFYRWAYKQIGKPYDKLAIFAFAAERNWRDPNAWFCDEMVAAGLEVAGYFDHPLAFAVNKLTPDGLLLALSVRVSIGA